MLPDALSHDVLLALWQVVALAWVWVHRGAVARRAGDALPSRLQRLGVAVPVGLAAGHCLVMLLCLLPENHEVHVRIEEVAMDAGVQALEGLARVGGWDEREPKPPGLVPKVDLAESVLRARHWAGLAQRLGGGSSQCELDELELWDRLGAELSSLVYDEDHARAVLGSRVVRNLDLPEGSAREVAEGAALPASCTSGREVCWQFLRLGATNAALLVRIGELVCVAHRGTLFNSIRDLLRALQTTLVTVSSASPAPAPARGWTGWFLPAARSHQPQRQRRQRRQGQQDEDQHQRRAIHRGWALEEIEILAQSLESWLVNGTVGIAAGHSKGGSRAQHMVEALPDLLDSSIDWHARSYSAPNWVDADAGAPPHASRALSSTNTYIDGDPLYLLFEWLGFERQLGATSRKLARPKNLGPLGTLYWVFRAHFLSSVAEHMTGEPVERHAFQLHVARGLVRLCAGLALALLLAALAGGCVRYRMRTANALARAGAKRARVVSDAVARANEVALELSRTHCMLARATQLHGAPARPPRLQACGVRRGAGAEAVVGPALSAAALALPAEPQPQPRSSSAAALAAQKLLQPWQPW
jgi:hypothetical protein